MVETSGKPTLVLNEDDDGRLKGSGRSVEAYNLFAAIDPVRESLVAFGGHHMAVGLTVMADQLATLKEAMEAAAGQQLADNAQVSLPIDGTLPLAEATLATLADIQALAPFGTDNPAPLFELVPTTVPQARAIGSDQQHEGVLGIVASHVVETSGKPTLVLNEDDDGRLKGSGRSVEAYNLFAAIDPVRESLVAFGGHHMAVGLTVMADQLATLKEAMEAAAGQQLADNAQVSLPITLVTLGLKVLQQTTRPGLAALIQEAGLIPDKLTETNIGFGIAPRLNALGRLQSAQSGVELLTTLDDERATALAKQVNQLNEKRQGLVK
ncbi:hypothetical protein WP50_03880, partial [Lactiplantibacillus plantarum]